MSIVIIHRSQSALAACRRVASAAEPSGSIRVAQEGQYRHQDGDAVVVRWDCHAELPIPVGIVDLNPVAAVRAARNKALARITLTDLAPPTWQDRGAIQYPAVIRPRRHKAGAHFHTAQDSVEARTAINRCGRGWYASTLIDKQREFRVFIVQNRVVAVSERFPGTETSGPSTVAWNLALGGRLINVAKKQWPLPVLTASLEAMRRLGLGWGAVDACIDRSGRAWVFEVNTSPALRNPFTIRQIARAFTWAGQEDAATYDLPARTESWKSIIHPGLR